MIVIKRDGSHQDFYLVKIHKVIEKTGICDTRLLTVSSLVLQKLNNFTSVNVEKIQDFIEISLMECGFHMEAKNFIIYRHLHHKQRIPKCQQPTVSFVPEYPFCDEVADKQAIDWEWTHLENDPTDDVANLISYCTDTQMKAVVFTSKILTTYEGELGERYWSGRFQRIFPRHEFRNAGLVLARMETQTHAKVYRKFNAALDIEAPGFYEDCKIHPALKHRMEFIDDAVNSPNDLLSLGTFALLEGVSLFCIFAFYKNFQNNGNNLLPKFVSNINFSARDETLHAKFGADCYKVLLEESFLSKVELYILELEIVKIANQLRNHELLIIDEMFAHGELPGITRNGLKGFVDTRLNLVLKMLGIDQLFSNHTYDEVSPWFNKGIDHYIYNDFFAKGGREYTRKFSPDDFEFIDGDGEAL